MGVWGVEGGLKMYSFIHSSDILAFYCVRKHYKSPIYVFIKTHMDGRWGGSTWEGHQARKGRHQIRI